MALELSFVERRVLGVLIEKGFTTPEQYPLSLNSVVVGSNQKSCRDPVSALGEEAVLDSLEALRRKGLATLVRTEGSRVDRWRHQAGQTLGLSPKDLAVLAELLLRGPQTDGELRQRASRMVPVESLEELAQTIEGLRTRSEPLVERLGAPGRKRGVKYAHLLYSPSERAALRKEGESEAPWEGEVPGEGEAPAEPPSRAWEEEAAPSQPSKAESFRPQVPIPAHPPSAAASDAIAVLEREVRALKERVEELESTFARFLR